MLKAPTPQSWPFRILKSKRARRRVPSSQFRSTSRRLRAGALGEAAYRFGFRVVDVENGQELGDLQNFLKLPAQGAELERGALRLAAVMRAPQPPHPAPATDVHILHLH